MPEGNQSPFLSLLIQGAALGALPLALITLFCLPALHWATTSVRKKADNLVPKGYTKLGRRNFSNLHDESKNKYAIQDSHDSVTWNIKALFIHPIKSCAGIEMDSVAVDGAGLIWDRKFAIAELLPPAKKGPDVDPAPIWTFRTLRQPGYERLAKVRPEIWLKDEDMDPEGQQTAAAGYMVIKYPYLPSGLLAPLGRLLLHMGLIDPESAFRVPLVPPENHAYPVEDVTIWKDTPKWLNYAEHVPKAFQSWLGAKNPVTLFRVDRQTYREVFRNAPRKEQLGFQPMVGFADSYPVHLLNLASVRDVALRVNGAIPQFTARRFRSNILVTGGARYDEDDWKMVKIGQHLLYCACHTIRCRLPNVDPDTAIRHPVEPDKTLRSFRCVDPGEPLGAALGLQLVPASDNVFELRVGDEIKVLERGEHLYRK